MLAIKRILKSPWLPVVAFWAILLSGETWLFLIWVLWVATGLIVAVVLGGLGDLARGFLRGPFGTAESPRQSQANSLQQHLAWTGLRSDDRDPSPPEDRPPTERTKD